MSFGNDKFAYYAFEGLLGLYDILIVDFKGEFYQNRNALLNMAGRTFGGQLASNSLAVACTAAPDRIPFSLHACFVNPGNPSRPFDYTATTLRAGCYLSHVSVSCLQVHIPAVAATIILGEAAALQGNQHQFPNFIPPASGVRAQEAESRASLIVRHQSEMTPFDQMLLRSYNFIDIRDINGMSSLSGSEQSSRKTHWLRVPCASGLSSNAQYALLTLLTDFWYGLLMYFQIRDRKTFSSIHFASLDHSIWFHRAPKCDDWLLFEAELLFSGEGFTLCRAAIFMNAINL